MRLFTPLTVVVLILVLLPVSFAEARASDGAAVAAAKKKPKGKAKARVKRKSCKKGYALRTVKVKRKGKVARVKRCRKKAKGKRPATTLTPPSTQAPSPTPAPGAPRPLFDPPGSTLEDAAARAYIERYLLNSRFTDCPGGWPSCATEQRYSHFANTTVAGANFFQCRLTTIAGLGINFPSLFFYETGVVRPDGSWSVNEIVLNGGRPSFYEWIVAADGTVTGTYKFPGLQPEPIGPLRYMVGARDCSA